MKHLLLIFIALLFCQCTNKKNDALLKIKEREKNILLQRFMVGKTQMEIADELGISQAQVSRLEKSAIENVRKLIK